MNTITTLVTIFTLWLVMGLGFLSDYSQSRRQGASTAEAVKSVPGILFFLTVFTSTIFFIIKISS
jgi:hypothetical protein